MDYYNRWLKINKVFSIFFQEIERKASKLPPIFSKNRDTCYDKVGTRFDYPPYRVWPEHPPFMLGGGGVLKGFEYGDVKSRCAFAESDVYPQPDLFRFNE